MGPAKCGSYVVTESLHQPFLAVHIYTQPPKPKQPRVETALPHPNFLTVRIDFNTPTLILPPVSDGRMSTPSIATATLPPYHPHHARLAYPHHLTLPALSQHSPSDAAGFTASTRRLPAHTSNLYHLQSVLDRTAHTEARKPSQSGPKASTPEPAMPPHPRQPRQPDWNEFYRNGIPQEIIVIDDDSPGPHQANGVQNTNQSAPGTIDEPASKKRRTGLAQGPNAAKHTVAYSNANTPHYAVSPSDTVSAGRTTSLQTTAPTSLGSSGSGGSGVYPEAAVTGQKRKRVTRQTTADEKKRREFVQNDALQSYYPPPQPPIKASAVDVRVIRDVSVTTNRCK